MSDTELKELVASLILAQRETERRMQETDQRLRESREETDRALKESGLETDRRMQETDRRMRETDRQIKELGRQIGGLGNKWGSFTEGLCYESCRRILRQDFGMQNIEHEVEIQRPDGTSAEFDMVGHTNGGRSQGMIVEIKSHVSPRDIEQTLDSLAKAKEFLPQLKDCRVQALIAAVYFPKGMEKTVRDAGLHLAVGSDENFQLVPPPPDFVPKET